MNKFLVRMVGGLIILLAIIFFGIIAYDNRLHKLEDLRPPSRISSYWDIGYFKIDPETILVSLENGNTNVFTPLPEDVALDLEELSNLSIYWSQTDFLNIASAMGRIVWDDPMSLNDWGVYSIHFDGSCGDNVGLDFARITYFQTTRKMYATRLIEIFPHLGWARWGSGEIYPKPVLRKWGNVDLLESKISAEEAIRIANDDVKASFQINNDRCGVMMSSYHAFNNWDLTFLLGTPEFVSYGVDRYTGEYTIQKPNK